MEKVALVTGSTNNVSKGIAEILSKDGFLVIVTSRHGNDAREVADHLPNQTTVMKLISLMQNK